jgi:glucokinase
VDYDLPQASALAGPVLIADVGGSTSRFALATGGMPERVMKLPNDSVTSFEAAVARYLDVVGTRPAAAVFAVAAPIDGDEVAMTNRAWRFGIHDMSARFGFDVTVLNDFEALAWAVLGLTEQDTRHLGGPAGERPGVRVVLGPGTGLGVAAMVPTKSGWHAVASEGGHVAFGPDSAEEEPVFAQLRAECGESVSAETVLSGAGLVRLNHVLHSAEAAGPEAILAAARAGDRAALGTVALFSRLLGRFAGDAALTFKATGGVYVAGGVAMGMGPLLDAAVFRAGFDAHPACAKLLGAIPTRLITSAEPGLLGCAALVGQRARPGLPA